MRRVTRENSWGKLINKQVTRWVGSRQIDMRARGTQKTRTEATCSHKTKTQAHGQQTNHQPCAKQDMNTQLMRKLISHVFTQDMTTWKHAANEYTSCVPHSTRYNKCTQPIETRIACNTTKHTWTRVCGLERTRNRTLTQWQKMERECPNPDTNRNSRHECRDPNTTLHTKQCTQTRERATRAHSKPRAHMKTRTWWEYQGSVTKPWISLDRSSV